ncbi:methyltransferase domain-containing protein [Nocardia sp. CDC159]|uniref:Methyltransferase domain-containing protein n=1 Tax=Nocardia pulmonis TaxID=2951408 RepID=A0A9X2IXG5_9NOCA|nr:MULTISPECIES: class I SAM-dependent methyltransferase [Nocardia]MCM6775358.1 methyltransferase domain-containing protein [Nocardia pulmonis]MCM6787908.1 methyltransferase domain-containing protein [Nocardia sp. CDC159]
MTTSQQQRAGRRGTGTSTDDPAAAEAVFLDATLSLLAPLGVAAGDVVVDVGPGAGTAAVALATAVGEHGRVYAVDLDPVLLEATMAAARRAGVDDRVHPVLHDVEDGVPPVPEAADAVWSSWCVHHTRDWEAAVRALVGMLRPGGRLCLAEGGLPTRCLPWDAGIGRPGLEIRLDEAHDRHFRQWFFGRSGARRPGRGWDEILVRAGLTDVTTFSTLVDIPAPLSDEVRGVVLAELAARVGRAQRFLSEEDAAAWARLLDPEDDAWLGHRADLGLLTARTGFRGRRPGP